MDARSIPGLEVEVLHGGQAAVFTLSGRMDRAHFDDTNALLADTLDRGCRYLVGDCSRATHISSTGIGFLGYYAQRARERGGELIMVRPPEGAVRGMDLAKFKGLVRFFDARGEALDYVGSAVGA